MSETQAKQKRVPPKAWKPGQSGNPKGRPPTDPELKEAIRKLTPLAIKTLEEIAEHGDTDSARMKAVDSILERSLGKVPQVLQGATEGPPIKFNIGFPAPGGSDAQ